MKTGHRGITRVFSSTKLPGTNTVTPPLAQRGINGRGLDQDVDSMGEQSEHMSVKMSELERVFHVHREKLREENNRNRQEISRSEKRLKEWTDEYLAKNVSQMAREAEERERRLRLQRLSIQG